MIFFAQSERVGRDLSMTLNRQTSFGYMGRMSTASLCMTLTKNGRPPAYANIFSDTNVTEPSSWKLARTFVSFPKRSVWTFFWGTQTVG
jgi:hypothetical protein